MSKQPSRAAAGVHLDSLDALRGLAALSVMLFHYSWNGATHHGYPADDPVKFISRYGYLGVYVFFVVSGFIIPWTMDRAGYRLRNYFTFLWKRLLRIHPPFLLAVLVMAGVELCIHPDPLATLQHQWGAWWRHFFYLNDLTGHPWLLDIFWTLALEMQFYLLIGLLLPLLVARQSWLRWLGLIGFTATAFAFGETTGGIEAKALVHHYAGHFALGITGFWWFTGRVRPWAGALALLLATAAVLHTHGWTTALLSLATILVILFVRIRHPLTAWLGAVSYPLYLFHLTTGEIVNRAGSLLPRNPWWDTILVLLAVAVSLAAASAVHRWLETPCQRWSSAVKYRPRRQAASHFP